MYGWKGRIALLVPARNTTMEPEFYKMAPEGITIHTARMFLKDVSASSLIQMEKEMYRATSLIKDLNPDIIVVGCTSGGFIKGKEYNSRIIEKIKKLAKTQAISTATAVIEALKLMEIKKVAVATPYIKEVNEKEKEFLENYGIQVTNIRGLGYYKPVRMYPIAPKPVSGIGLLEPYVAYRLGLDVDTRDSDGILLSCTNLRTIEIIETLENNVQKPVISSIQAAMWMALRKMGINEKIPGFGSLLEKPFSG